MKNYLVIEVSGGVVQEVYNNIGEYYILDWDALEEGMGIKKDVALDLIRMDIVDLEDIEEFIEEDDDDQTTNQ